jgi:hypothetical protein
MKIIFLDIDGVICLPSSMKFHLWGPDPNCVAQVNRIIEVTGAKIVLSSSWKHIEPTYPAAYQRVLNLGIRGEIIDHTPDEGSIRGAGDREKEIHRWLIESYGSLQDAPGFVILDDYPMENDLKEFSIKTTWVSGLTKELADQAIGILEK